MNVIDLIRRDHDEIAAQFSELIAVARVDRRSFAQLAPRLVTAVRIHAGAEERVIYEALRAAPAPCRAFALAGPHAHETLDSTLDKLLVARPREEARVLVRVAFDLFEMHARDEEEQEILPRLADAFGVGQLLALGRELAAEQARIRPRILLQAGLSARAA